MQQPAHIFGYASLTTAPHAVPAQIRGWRRAWNVAMDNTRAIPGYKRYVDPDGDRPPAFVAFLDLVPAPSMVTEGCLIPVDAARLAQLDRRERNYQRRPVEAATADGEAVSAWVYTGLDEAAQRFQQGLMTGTLSVAREYVERVRAGFAALGEQQLARYEAEPGPPCPIETLRRVEL